jgi:hypothetical protein
MRFRPRCWNKEAYNIHAIKTVKFVALGRVTKVQQYLRNTVTPIHNKMAGGVLVCVHGALVSKKQQQHHLIALYSIHGVRRNNLLPHCEPYVART